AGDRRARRVGHALQGDRRTAVPVHPDGQQPPAAGVHQGRGDEPGGARCSARATRGRSSMTPEQIALVQESFATMDHAALAVDFYDRLFTDHPEVRAMFSTEPAVQRQKLVDELSAIVWSIANLDEFLAVATALGARHAGYGTEPLHYSMVREAMLGAIAAQLGENNTAALAEAWRSAYDLVAEAMMLGAAGSA